MIKFTNIRNKNRKGFAMAELLAVCIVVLFIFTILFSNYLPLVAEYENRSVYNNVTAQYAAHHIRKAYAKVIDSSTVLKQAINDQGYDTAYKSGSIDVKYIVGDEKEKIKKLLGEYKIEEIIITKYTLSNDDDTGFKDKLGQSGGYPTSGKLYNYIKYLPGYERYRGEEVYRIILKSSEFGYATTPIKYSDALQEFENAPNHPVLSENMFAVKYFDNCSDGGSCWKVVSSKEDDSEYWYNYTNGEWANSIIVKSGVRDEYEYTGDGMEPGKEVKMEDVLTMQVWIPRFKYTVWNYNSDGKINGEHAAKKPIQIDWEKGIETSGEINCSDLLNMGTSDGTPSGTLPITSETCKIKATNEECTNSTCNGRTYTHPAFTFDGEITGFWIGKFEIAKINDEIVTKPGVTNLKSQSVSDFATTITNMKDKYGLKEENKEYVHMIKNSEWGAVAYLTNSKYGVCNNDRCTSLDSNVGYNNNNGAVTGCGASYDSSASYSSSCSQYDTDTGMLSSTTKNIYGVYDMSGGTWEYVMGNMVSYDGKTMMSGSKLPDSHSGYTGIVYRESPATIYDFDKYTGGRDYPSDYYYDKYSYGTSMNDSNALKRGKLGDGIKEIAGGTNWDFKTTEVVFAGYYSENAINGYSWFVRGGGFVNSFGNEASGAKTNGIFSSKVNFGNSHSKQTTRLAIVLPAP